jgi:hypothetical protein
VSVAAPAFPPCRRCGSTDVVEIVYGLPDVELRVAAERGEVVLGGCIVGDELPDYDCRGCGSPLPWVRPEADDDESIIPSAATTRCVTPDA